MKGGDIAKRYGKSNIGRRVPASNNPVAGGFRLSDTQLITARWEQARQWIVTLMPATKTNGSTPWISTFDGGTAYPPVAPAIFTAPEIPGGGAGTEPKCHLRWGAGGVAFETRFDYPQHGAIFGVTADSFDLNVFFDPNGNFTTEVPEFGAFMVPGFAADPTPLHWLEAQRSIAAAPGPGHIRYWAVKPWSRTVRVAVTSGLVGNEIQLVFLNTNNITLFLDRFSIESGTGLVHEVEIPATATVLGVQNLSVDLMNVIVDWQIGLT